MKQDTLTPLMVRLILTTGILLLFTWEANASEQGAMKGMGSMQGVIEAAEKNVVLLTLGDRVKLKLKDPEAVIRGDRMDIYETAKTGLIDDRGDELLTWSGRLVITNVDGGMVMGTLEAANREVLVGSHLIHTGRDDQRPNRYSSLMRMMTASMADPARDFITVALPGVTDGGGNETRLSEAVSVALREAFCGRPQFHCVEKAKLRAMLGEYDVRTGASAGELMRGKTAARFDADWFVTGQLAQANADVTYENVNAPSHLLTVTAYDLRGGNKKYISTYPLTAGEYAAVKGDPNVVTAAYKATRHAYLKISIDDGVIVSDRRVDGLFLVPLDEYVDIEYRQHLGNGSDGRVVMGNIEMTLDGKPLRRDTNGAYYDDIIIAGSHALRISAVPSLVGRGQRPIGKRFERSVELAIAPDTALVSQVVVGVIDKQGLVAVDTRPMKEYPFVGVMADGR